MSEWNPEIEAELERQPRTIIEREVRAAIAEIRRLRDVAQNAVNTLHDYGATKRVEGALAMRARACAIANTHGEDGYRAARDIISVEPEDV